LGGHLEDCDNALVVRVGLMSLDTGYASLLPTIKRLQKRKLEVFDYSAVKLQLLGKSLHMRVGNVIEDCQGVETAKELAVRVFPIHNAEGQQVTAASHESRDGDIANLFGELDLQ
jgi:hypothetical protein